MHEQAAEKDAERQAEENGKGINWYMYFCCYTVGLVQITNGASAVWTSPVILQLKSADPDVNPLGTPISSLHVSLLASIPTLVGTFSPFLVAGISDKLGRLRMMQYMAPVGILSFCGIAFANDIYIYLVFWAIYGFLRCGIVMNAIIYASEVAENLNRGRIGMIMEVCFLFGMEYGYVFGSITNVRGFSLICTIPLIIFLLLSTKLVESPIYSASKGKTSEAVAAYKKLGKSKQFESIEMKQEVKEKVKLEKTRYSDILKTRASRKALFISLTLSFMIEFSGVTIIFHFIGFIFHGLALSGNVISIIIGLVQFCIMSTSSCFVEKIGKRTLVLIASCICSISMFFLAVYFHLNYVEHPWATQFNWLPIVFVIMFISGCALGLMPVSNIIMNEVFCTELRSFGFALSKTLCYVLGVILLFTYPLISELYGDHCLMYMYSITTGILCTLLYFILPETTGKSLSEIQELLNR